MVLEILLNALEAFLGPLVTPSLIAKHQIIDFVIEGQNIDVPREENVLKR